MNIFRFIADMLHLAAILTLLYRIKVVRNCIGKSPAPLMTQPAESPSSLLVKALITGLRLWKRDVKEA
jgi:hypothetical protein